MTSSTTSAGVLDVVIPVRDEAGGLEGHVRELQGRVRAAGLQPRVILVDDGSVDGTWEVVKTLAAESPSVAGVRLSRNFGKDAALFAGLQLVRGVAAVTIDADGQHPAEVIGTMVHRWRQGCLVVNGRKMGRLGDAWHVRLRAGLFNRVMSWLMEVDVQGTTDFKLLDRQAVDALLRRRSGNSVYRFLVAGLGFPSADIDIDTKPSSRTSRWSLYGLVALAARAVMFHTEAPIKLFLGMLFATMVMTACLMVLLAVALLQGRVPTGYSTLLLLLIGNLCVTMLGLSSVVVYVKGALDVVSGRDGGIVWQVVGDTEK
jgi:glycosyltransferase involved in cell wall biosynthesis